MNSLPNKSTPPWQIERAGKLHRACLRIEAARARGEKICKYVLRTARRYNGRPFKCDPARRMRLCTSSLWRLYRKWRRSGKVASALILKYCKRPPYVPRLFMLRFVDFCASHRIRSMNGAWQEFSKLKKNVPQAKSISYGQVRYFFSGEAFQSLQLPMKEREAADARLTTVLWEIKADITNRLPERPPRRRVKHETDFQI
jgi:hypothetical protein